MFYTVPKYQPPALFFWLTLTVCTFLACQLWPTSLLQPIDGLHCWHSSTLLMLVYAVKILNCCHFYHALNSLSCWWLKCFVLMEQWSCNDILDNFDPLPNTLLCPSIMPMQTSAHPYLYYVIYEVPLPCEFLPVICITCNSLSTVYPYKPTPSKLLCCFCKLKFFTDMAWITDMSSIQIPDLSLVFGMFCYLETTSSLDWIIYNNWLNSLPSLNNIFFFWMIQIFE